MSAVIGFFIGFFVGGIFGIVLMCALQINKPYPTLHEEHHVDQ